MTRRTLADRWRTWRHKRQLRLCRDCAGYQHAIYDLETRSARCAENLHYDDAERCLEIAETVRMNYLDHRLTHPAYADEYWRHRWVDECNRTRQWQNER